MSLIRCTGPNGEAGWKWGPNGTPHFGPTARISAIHDANNGGNSTGSPALSEQSLLELSYADQLRVDRDTKVIYGVKVLGRQSKNGYVYSDRTLDQLVNFYEGINVNVEHPDVKNPTKNRLISELFGKLRSPRKTADGIYADLHYLDNHHLAKQVAEIAESMPDKIGLSHNADGRLNKETNTVEHVNFVRSVDLVREPATTRGLFEQREEDNPMADAPATEQTGLSLVEQAFEIEISNLVRDRTITQEQRLARMEQLLEGQRRAAAVLNGETPEPVTPVQARTAELIDHQDQPPELVAELEQLRAINARNQRLTEARTHLEQAQCRVTEARVQAIADMDENNRTVLINEWRRSDTLSTKPATSAPLRESVQGGGGQYANTDYKPRSGAEMAARHLVGR